MLYPICVVTIRAITGNYCIDIVKSDMFEIVLINNYLSYANIVQYIIMNMLGVYYIGVEKYLHVGGVANICRPTIWAAKWSTAFAPKVETLCWGGGGGGGGFGGDSSIQFAIFLYHRILEYLIMPSFFSKWGGGTRYKLVIWTFVWYFELL